MSDCASQLAPLLILELRVLLILLGVICAGRLIGPRARIHNAEVRQEIFPWGCRTLHTVE